MKYIFVVLLAMGAVAAASDGKRSSPPKIAWSSKV
jgi:hypothetical protein